MTFGQQVQRRWALTMAAAVLVVGAGLQIAPIHQTATTFQDSSTVQGSVRSSHWATRLCLIASTENRPDAGVYSLGSQAQLGNSGWTEVVDARTATTTTQLTDLGCSVVVIAGEAWGVQPAKRDIATAWYNAGGSVLSTGNDTGHTNYPLPLLIQSLGDTAVVDYPYGGSVPASAVVLNSVSPAFPTWTPGTTYDLDNNSYPIAKAAAGATCVGTVAGHPTWCAAIARTDAKTGGRWVHLHTKIGSLDSPGEVPGADAALKWLAIGKS